MLAADIGPIAVAGCAGRPHGLLDGGPGQRFHLGQLLLRDQDPGTAMQAWPLFMNPAWIARGTASARSASSRIITGDLPPNSRVTRLSVSAPARTRALPTAVEPVKELRHVRVCTQFRADRLAASGDDIEYAGRQSRLMQGFGDDTGLHSAHLARLDHRRTAGAIAAASLTQIAPALLFQGVDHPATPSGVMTTSAVPARRVNS